MKKSLLFPLVILSSAILSAGVAPRQSQLRTLPGSVIRGESLLTTSGCVNCHALNGQGGKRAPDLSALSNAAGAPSQFATSLWNHMPSMIAEIETAKIPAPDLKPGDAADLFAYFYSTLYFSPTGNALRGERQFTEKQCASCHSEVLNTDTGRAILETWMDLKDPSIWAERMWNHASEMERAMANRGVNWPVLSDRDVVDLMTFLSTRAGTRGGYAFSIGEPEQGRAVFDNSCTSCHTMGSREKSKVDLLDQKAPESVTGYIAAMWNHAPDMKRKGGTTPKLAPGEMSDLIAFLFSQRFFFEPGNAERGKRVYESKDCVTCHDVRRADTGAPDLTKAVEAYSPILLTSAAWRHGSAMMKRMKQERIAWPEFKKNEMADLIAFLNSRLIVRLAGPQ